MEEAIRFAVLAQSGRFTVKELCEQFGISRKTGYKQIECYEAGADSRANGGRANGGSSQRGGRANGVRSKVLILA